MKLFDSVLAHFLPSFFDICQNLPQCLDGLAGTDRKNRMKKLAGGKSFNKKYKETTIKDMESTTKNSTGLCVKLHLVDVAERDIIIKGMNFVPRKGDLIKIENIIDKTDYSEKELEGIRGLQWRVWYVSWDKDDDGFYATLVCEGE